MTTALTWHAWGIPVLPVIFKPKKNGPGTDKIPIVKWKHWLKGAAQTAEDVRTMPWDRAEAVGILLWPTCPRVVVDLDGEGADKLLLEAGVALPPTGTIHTRSGGRHYHLNVRPGMKPPNPDDSSRDKRAICLLHATDAEGKPCKPAVDFLFNGMVVVAGPGYREDPDHPVDPSGLADVPEAILELARSKNGGSKTTQEEGGTLQTEYATLLCGVPLGVQHDTSLKLIGHYLPKLGPAETWAMIEDWCDRCTPPADTAKVRATFEDIRASEAAKGQSAQEPVACEQLPTHEPLDAFMAREIKAAPSLVGDGVFVEKGLHQLVGPTKKGKTIFAGQFALTLAGGREYWLVPELLVRKPTKTLYLNLEMPEPVFEGRLQAQLRQARADGYDVPKAWGNFRYLTLRGKMRLDRKDGRELLVRLIRETGAGLVIVDNLGAAMAVDSNADERMAPIFLSLYEICEAESVAILLVLHTPKELGDRDEVYWARGSSIQSDRADTIITMRPYGNDEQAIQRRIGFTLRCGPEVDPIIVSRQRGSLLWTAGKQKDVRVRWLRELIREEKEMPYQAALEAFEAAGHGKDRTFRTTLAQLKAEVFCHKDGFDTGKAIRWTGV